jgi:hypothetical protein
MGMTREFSVIIEQDAEGYYVASVPVLRGCHTQAKSLDEFKSVVSWVRPRTPSSEARIASEDRRVTTG